MNNSQNKGLKVFSVVRKIFKGIFKVSNFAFRHKKLTVFLVIAFYFSSSIFSVLYSVHERKSEQKKIYAERQQGTSLKSKDNTFSVVANTFGDTKNEKGFFINGEEVKKDEAILVGEDLYLSATDLGLTIKSTEMNTSEVSNGYKTYKMSTLTKGDKVYIKIHLLQSSGFFKNFNYEKVSQDFEKIDYELFD